MHVDLRRVREALQKRSHKVASLRGDEWFAAVAAVLRERENGAEVLLIRRSEQDGDPWSGHMAFPGGRRDPTDRDLLHTALREAEEEVGLELREDRHLVARLDDLPAVANGRRVGLIIAPFVFAVDEHPELVPNEQEVKELVWAPLTPMIRGDCDTTIDWNWEGRKVSLPAYDVSGRVVWGLTYMMLRVLFERMGA